MQFVREGEELSKKQLALESSLKKLRAQQKDGDLARKDLETKFLMEQQKVGILHLGSRTSRCQTRLRQLHVLFPTLASAPQICFYLPRHCSYA